LSFGYFKLCVRLSIASSPEHWTPEQANTVDEFLGDIENAIRKKYQTQILTHQLYELYRKEQYCGKNGRKMIFKQHL